MNSPHLPQDIAKEAAYEEINDLKLASEIIQNQNPSYVITSKPPDIVSRRRKQSEIQRMYFFAMLGILGFLVVTMSIGCGSIVISLKLQSEFDLLKQILNSNNNNVMVDLQSEISHLKANVNNIVVILSHLQSSQNAVDSFWQVTGLFSNNPATSCESIFRSLSVSITGYYWIRASNGSALRVYCDMTRSCGGVTGGWMRVAKLDMTNQSNHCPNNFRLVTESGVRSCGIHSSYASCSSVHFDVGGFSYDKVCGRIIAYQWGTPDAFTVSNQGNLSLDSIYVDGISLTYGNPRSHIWTFAASNDENPNIRYNCPCVNTLNPGSSIPPAFINPQEYFCDTGSANMQSLVLYEQDPLWDGAGCGRLSSCCSLNNPPWFYKQLELVTNENIEMRACSDEPRINEDIAIKLYELYIQ